MKEAVEHCHNNGIVIGDLNQYNLFFSLKGDILFVDVDSYSEKGNIRTDVLLEDIRDFTTNTISELSDAYAFDILAFWSLCFVHPYKWMVPGNTENLEVRVKSGKSILDKIPGIKIPPLYNPPSKTLEPQFIDIFKKKRRFMIELDDKVLVPAINVQLNTVVTSSSVTVVTHKDSIYDIKVFGDNLAVKTSNDHWQILKCNSKGIFIPKDIIKCEELFISDNNFCYTYNNSLYSSKRQAVRGLENTYHYFQNGQLFVLDYERDSASIYNIESQLVNIDYNKFVIFAESIVIRQSILQNFGAKKVTGILKNKTLCITDIPLSTKDLIISGKYYCAEYIENKKVKTSIFEIKGTSYEKST
jgi:hypothetical protein